MVIIQGLIGKAIVAWTRQNSKTPEPYLTPIPADPSGVHATVAVNPIFRHRTRAPRSQEQFQAVAGTPAGGRKPATTRGNIE